MNQGFGCDEHALAAPHMFVFRDFTRTPTSRAFWNSGGTFSKVENLLYGNGGLTGFDEGRRNFRLVDD